jgi:thymidylate synthase
MEVQGANAIEAWKKAANLILQRGELHNLSVTIDGPFALARNAVLPLSPRSIVAKADDVFEVANTIFPAQLSSRATDRDDLYNRYSAIMERLRKRRGGLGTWGTYFERLICFGTTQVNQLDRVINKLNTWPNASKTGLVFHTSSPETDSPRTRGGPCWHYGELLCHRDGKIDLFAVYRNQDYFNKALGNFIGLSDLLNFICLETGHQPGKLICNAAHAFNGGRKSDLAALVLR